MLELDEEAQADVATLAKIGFEVEALEAELADLGICR